MKHKFLVTGANGHLGFNVCQQLRAEGYEVAALVLPNDKTDRLENLGIRVFRGDVTDIKSMTHFFDANQLDHTILIHCAGIVSITNKNLTKLYEVNVEGSKNIVVLSQKYGIKRVVYVSSVHAIGEDNNVNLITEPRTIDEEKVVGDYAKTKALTTAYMKQQVESGTDIIIVYPSGIVGPGDYGQGHLTMMIEDYLNGQLTSRVKGAYDFVDARDVARGIIIAALKAEKGEDFILSGHRVDLADLFNILRKIAGKKSVIHVLPTWFARFSAPLAECYYKLRKRPPIYSVYSLYTISSNANFSKQKAEQKLGYVTTPFEETLTATVAWLVEQGRIRNKRVITKFSKSSLNRNES